MLNRGTNPTRGQDQSERVNRMLENPRRTRQYGLGIVDRFGPYASSEKPKRSVAVGRCPSKVQVPERRNGGAQSPIPWGHRALDAAISTGPAGQHKLRRTLRRSPPKGSHTVLKTTAQSAFYQSRVSLPTKCGSTQEYRRIHAQESPVARAVSVRSTTRRLRMESRGREHRPNRNTSDRKTGRER